MEIPVSAFTFLMISSEFAASRMAEVAQAFKCFTSYTPNNSLYDLIVFISFSAFAAVIEPLSNTSKPRRRGTRTSATLINSGISWGPGITSVINNLAALLPISMAANLTWDHCFFMQVIICFYLRANFFPDGPHIFITQFIIEPPGFHIVLQLDI